jgi:antitoxin FitA
MEGSLWAAGRQLSPHVSAQGQIPLTNGLDMLHTCIYVVHMAKMIQLRNVPDELHRLLKARAALEGLSLSEYLLAEIRCSAERPTLRELRERLHQRTPVVPDTSPAEVIRELRDQP